MVVLDLAVCMYFATSEISEKINESLTVFGTPVDFIIDFIESQDIDSVVIFDNKQFETRNNLDKILRELYLHGKKVSVLRNAAKEVITRGSDRKLLLFLHADSFEVMEDVAFLDNSNTVLIKTDWDQENDELRSIYLPIYSQVGGHMGSFFAIVAFCSRYSSANQMQA